ncbi:hypothetical protein ACFQFH_14185 [Halobaculum halobium]|uniref:Uncharacterized protein n=1 Tax=Halobaculum halobium TaxID=3032281 RepID=A0ABD5TD08_9EURY|nr:hypothetical protein [Halobaculum sp. SYNS20]
MSDDGDDAADLSAALDTLVERRGRDRIERRCHEKATERGGFDGGVALQRVEEP